MGRSRRGTLDAGSGCRDDPPQRGRPSVAGRQLQLWTIRVRGSPRGASRQSVRTRPRRCTDADASPGVRVMDSLFRRGPGLRLLAGSMLFNLASGCYTITLAQALFEKSGSVSAFTGVVVIEYVVPVILGAIAGSMADRVNPAVVWAGASMIPALSLIAYLVAPAALVVVGGIAIGLIVNLVRPFYRAGIFAVGPRSLRSQDLPRYNMRWTVSVQAGQIVGGAVAGVFLWAAGPKLA